MNHFCASWTHLRNILEPSWAFHGSTRLQKRLQDNQKSLQTSQVERLGAIRDTCAPSWAVLEPFWSIVGSVWRHGFRIGAYLASLATISSRFGVISGRRGAYLARLGPILVRLGAISVRLGAILRPSGPR